MFSCTAAVPALSSHTWGGYWPWGHQWCLTALRSLTWSLHPPGTSLPTGGPLNPIQLSPEALLSPSCAIGMSAHGLCSCGPWIVACSCLDLGCSLKFLGDNWTMSDPALNSQPVLWMQLKLAATSTQGCWGWLAQAWHCWPCYSAWCLAPSPERSSRLLALPDKPSCRRCPVSKGTVVNNCSLSDHSTLRLSWLSWPDLLQAQPVSIPALSSLYLWGAADVWRSLAELMPHELVTHYWVHYAATADSGYLSSAVHPEARRLRTLPLEFKKISKTKSNK